MRGAARGVMKMLSWGCLWASIALIREGIGGTTFLFI